MASIESSFPALQAANEPLSDEAWESIISALGVSGVIGQVGGADLAAYRTASGLFVRPGKALVRGRRYALDGDDLQLPVVQNSTGAARFDLVVIRNNPAGTPQTRLVVIRGGTTTPSPSLTDTGAFDVRVAVLTVPSGSSVPSVVTDVRDFAATSVVPCRGVTEIPAGLRRIGMIATGTWGAARWDGTMWIPVSAGQANWFQQSQNAEISLGADGQVDSNGDTIRRTLVQRTTTDIVPSDTVRIDGRWLGFTSQLSGSRVLMRLHRGTQNGPILAHQWVALTAGEESGGGSLPAIDDTPGTNPTYVLSAQKRSSAGRVTLPAVTGNAAIMVQRARVS